VSKPSGENAVLYLLNIECSSLPEGCRNQLVRVTQAYESAPPSWSPDGQRIAYLSFGGVEYQGEMTPSPQVYVINADGSEEKRLVNMLSVNAYPLWSPDDSRIAFIRWGQGVYVVTPDGSGLTVLISESCHEQCVFYPQALSWSPDGTRMAVDVWRRGGAQYISVLDTSGDQTMQTIADWSTSPAWSPDGGHIAFVCSRERSGLSANPDICIVDVDSGEERRLTSDPAVDMDPVWSPDGTRLAFVSKRDGNYEIYTMNADGSRQTNLTNYPACDMEPAWSPDGTLIAFQSCRNDPNSAAGDVCDFMAGSCDNEIYMMNADGSGQTRLTNNPANDMYPVWSPR
jgi:Tol biopolymer transport system component